MTGAFAEQVTDDQQGAAGRDRCGEPPNSAGRSAPRGSAGTAPRRGRSRPPARPHVQVDRTQRSGRRAPGRRARGPALQRAGEKSTAVTRQPRSASHRASAPSPQPTSSAVPGRQDAPPRRPAAGWAARSTPPGRPVELLVGLPVEHGPHAATLRCAATARRVSSAIRSALIAAPAVSPAAAAAITWARQVGDVAGHPHPGHGGGPVGSAGTAVPTTWPFISSGRGSGRASKHAGPRGEPGGDHQRAPERDDLAGGQPHPGERVVGHLQRRRPRRRRRRSPRAASCSRSSSAGAGAPCRKSVTSALHCRHISAWCTASGPSPSTPIGWSRTSQPWQ